MNQHILRMSQGVFFLLTRLSYFLKILVSESASPNREEAEKKRKHDEILTDLGSEESDDDDLATFDLENYDSAEDPDYEVNI